MTRVRFVVKTVVDSPNFGIRFPFNGINVSPDVATLILAMKPLDLDREIIISS